MPNNLTGVTDTLIENYGQHTWYYDASVIYPWLAEKLALPPYQALFPVIILASENNRQYRHPETYEAYFDLQGSLVDKTLQP